MIKQAETVYTLLKRKMCPTSGIPVVGKNGA